MARECRHCAFYESLAFECRRYAPRPAQYPRMQSLDLHNSELLRDIAWTLHVAHEIEAPSKYDDLNTDAAQVVDDDRWPTVDPDDWCGEFEPRPAR
jgi:hypothetical protein